MNTMQNNRHSIVQGKESKVRKYLKLNAASILPKLSLEDLSKMSIKCLSSSQKKQKPLRLKSHKKSLIGTFNAQEKPKISRYSLNTKIDNSESTKSSIGSDAGDVSRFGNRQEEFKWVSIHNSMINRVKFKVEAVQRSRYGGFFSPQRLMSTINKVRHENIQKTRLYSMDENDSSVIPDLRLPTKNQERVSTRPSIRRNSIRKRALSPASILSSRNMSMITNSPILTSI